LFASTTKAELRLQRASNRFMPACREHKTIEIQDTFGKQSCKYFVI